MNPLPWFAVTGRIPYDDEDSCYVFQCQNEDAAIEAFKASIHKDAGKPRPPEDSEEAEVFINFVLKSDTKITVNGWP